MKLLRCEQDRRQFLVSHLDSRGVLVGVQLGSHLEPLLRFRVGDQIDDNFVTQQRLAAPVLTDVGEQSMLDLVPLAGSGWKVAHRDPETGLVCEFL